MNKINFLMLNINRNEVSPCGCNIENDWLLTLCSVPVAPTDLQSRGGKVTILFPLFSLSPPLPSFPPSPLQLEVGHLNQARGVGRAVNSLQRGLRQPKSILVHFSLKIWQLVATILMILLTVNCPNFVQFSIQLDVVSSGL